MLPRTRLDIRSGHLSELNMRPAALALLALLVAAPALAEDEAERKAEPQVTITAAADDEVVPDIAVIRLSVATERRSAADAAAENARAATAVVDQVKALGVEPRDVRTLSVTVSPLYDEERGPNRELKRRTLRGYGARNSLEVRVRRIDQAGAIARQLIDKGANVFEGVSFHVSDEESRLDALRVRAVQDALRKARLYTEALGVKLGRVLVFEPIPSGVDLPRRSAPVQYAPASGEAPPVVIPVEPGVRLIRAEVRATWELVQ